MNNRHRTYLIGGALVLLLPCRSLAAMPLGHRSKQAPRCPQSAAHAPSGKQTEPQAAESIPKDVRHACPPDKAREGPEEANSSVGAPTAAAGPRPARGLETGWNGNHFFIRKKDRFEVEPNGYFQFTYRDHVGPAAPRNGSVLRRAVLGVRGTLGKRYDYNVSFEINDHRTPLHTASLQVNYNPAFQLRLGRFKQPFSRQTLVSSRYREFAERAMINDLAPEYGAGVMAQGRVFGNTIEYQAGIFGGKGALAQQDSTTPDGVARLRFSPWLRSHGDYLRGMTFGSAFARGRTNRGEGFEGATASGSLVFFAPKLVNGNVTRANGEWTWLVGPAGFHAEYTHSRQDRQGLGPGGGDLPGVVAWGYYVSSTYLITGESRAEDAQPAPHFPVFGRGRRGFGAWEVKFRYSTLRMSDGVMSNQVETLTPGLNWYLTRFVRIMLDLNVERLRKPVVLPVPRQPGTLLSTLVTTQFQF